MDERTLIYDTTILMALWSSEPKHRGVFTSEFFYSWARSWISGRQGLYPATDYARFLERVNVR